MRAFFKGISEIFCCLPCTDDDVAPAHARGVVCISPAPPRKVPDASNHPGFAVIRASQGQPGDIPLPDQPLNKCSEYVLRPVREVDACEQPMSTSPRQISRVDTCEQQMGFSHELFSPANADLDITPIHREPIAIPLDHSVLSGDHLMSGDC